MAEVSKWKQFRYRLEYLGVALFAWVVPCLSRQACVVLAKRIGSIAYHLDARGRAVALDNLRCAFGDRYTPEEREAIAKGSYQTFARTMFDLFWARNLTQENWSQYIIDGEETPDFFHGEGMIGLGTHWGNFEWLGLTAGFRGRPSVVVAENFKNPLLSDLFNSAREVSGNTVIPQENSMIRMLKVAKRKGTVALLADLTFPPDQAAVPTTAFGMFLSSTSLHAVLAARGGAVIRPGCCEPLEDGRAVVRYYPPLRVTPDTPVEEIVQTLWSVFEKQIAERPELWMWFYKHWRYRPRSAEPADYPFYANVSSKFEKLLVKHGLSDVKSSKGTASLH